MPFTIVILAWRKPGLSPTEFKTHYEKVHMPLLQSIAGDKFPISHTRHYIQRTTGENPASDKTNAAHPAVTLVGDPKDFDYDAYSELVFEDDSKFQEFFALVSAPEAAAKIAADEDKFLDRPKMKVASVDQMSVTRRGN